MQLKLSRLVSVRISPPPGATPPHGRRTCSQLLWHCFCRTSVFRPDNLSFGPACQTWAATPKRASAASAKPKRFQFLPRSRLSRHQADVCLPSTVDATDASLNYRKNRNVPDRSSAQRNDVPYSETMTLAIAFGISRACKQFAGPCSAGWWLQ